jgi:hypothetical protein
MLEILEASYWEHYKWAKDLAHYLPVSSPKRLELEKVLNEMLIEINKLRG